MPEGCEAQFATFLRDFQAAMPELDLEELKALRSVVLREIHARERDINVQQRVCGLADRIL